MFEQAKKNQFLRAVKHGAFAKMAILPGEDPKEFEELHSAIIEEWAPDGPTEEDAVLSIAKGVWRKRRQQKFLYTEIDKCSWDPEHPLFDEARGLRTALLGRSEGFLGRGRILPNWPFLRPTDPLT